MKAIPLQPRKTFADDAHRYYLKPEDTLVLAIDIQENHYAEFEHGFTDIFLQNSRNIMNAAHDLNIPIIVSERNPEKFGKTIPQVDKVMGNALKITKYSSSCWREGQIRAAIKATARNTLLIIGMETHLCVLQTVMELLQTGYNPVVVADAVCSHDSFHKDIALCAMIQAGAVVYPAETVMCMLMENTAALKYGLDTSLQGEKVPYKNHTPEAMNE